MIDFLTNNKEIIALVIAYFTLIVPLLQYLETKKKEQDQTNFERFHEKMVRKISNQSGDTGLDEQVAVIYDLRRFSEYYPVSKRILVDLQEWWKPQLKEKPQFKRLIKEADESIKYIDENSNIFKRSYSKIKVKYF